MGGWLRMKLTDLAILFIIIIIPTSLVLDIRTKNIEAAVYKRIEINKILETVIEDGVSSLIEEGGGVKNFSLNKEKAIEEVLTSLYNNFNVLDKSTDAIILQGYISCIAIIDYDGYYLVSNQEYVNSEGYKEMKLICGPKKSYSYYEDGYVYSFTLDNYLKIFDSWDNSFYIDTRDKIVEKLDEEGDSYPDFLSDDELFDDFRRKKIIELLQRDINYTINKHNLVARQFGISYYFSLPVLPEEDWFKTIDDVGMIMFFQGMPIGVTGEKINSYATGVTRIVKGEKYYISEEELEPGVYIKYYHKPGCTEIEDDIRTFDSKKECAQNGYFPCPVCFPY
jgi:hypothetical protein